MIESGNILRRARKTWRCFSQGAHERGWQWALTLPTDHQAVIRPGDKYVENMDEAPGYQSGTRYCVACAKAFAGWQKEQAQEIAECNS